ncbi:MAG: hypothetical protein KIT10_15195 [Flavobacteriales bacterium]|nr:hypothetical protein [Flavobacteriales bacterium]
MPGILLAIAYTALLLYFMRRMPFFARVRGLPMRRLALFFLLKILAGTALWAIYTWVYTERVHADVFKYFDDSAVMFSALPARPGDYLRMLFGIRNDNMYFTETYYNAMNNWFREYESDLYNDAHTVIRFNALVRLFSFGHFHVHTVFASFLALTGLVGLYRAFASFLPGREQALAIMLFLLPSTLLWSSGAIKESLLFFGLGMLVWQVFRLLEGRILPAGIAMLLFSMVLLFFLKFYVLLSLLPAMLAYAWSRGRQGAWWRFAVVYALYALIGLNLHHVITGADILGILAHKQKDFIGLAMGTESGSFVMPVRLEAQWWSFAAQAPYALYITLLGPLTHAAPGAMGSLAAAENLVLILAVALLLWYRNPLARCDRPFLLMLLGYVLVLALVIGWTTPVMGAIVRYRTPLLPFLLIAALHLFDHRRALARWPRLGPFLSA